MCEVTVVLSLMWYSSFSVSTNSLYINFTQNKCKLFNRLFNIVMNKLQEYNFKMKKCNIPKLTITYSFFALLEGNICLTSNRVKYVPLSILLCFLLYCLLVLQCHVEIAKACTPRSVKPCCQQYPRLTQFWFIASIIKTKPKPVKVQHSWALRSPRASRADAAHTSTISLSGSWCHLELLSSKWRTEFLLVLLRTYLWKTYK